MGHVFEKDAHMGHGLFAGELLVHVGLKGQGLHVFVFADLDESLAAAVGGVPEPLHHAQHPEHGAVLFHEAFAGEFEGGPLTGGQHLVRSFSGQLAAEHGVVNAFA